MATGTAYNVTPRIRKLKKVPHGPSFSGVAVKPRRVAAGPGRLGRRRPGSQAVAYPFPRGDRGTAQSDGRVR